MVESLVFGLIKACVLSPHVFIAGLAVGVLGSVGIKRLVARLAKKAAAAAVQVEKKL